MATPAFRAFLSPFSKGGHRGIFKIFLENLPLPLFFKEGYKDSFLLFKPITDALLKLRVCYQLTVLFLFDLMK